MGIAVAVIEQLDGETVQWPVHPRCAGGNTHRQRAFVTDRKLDQHMRQVRLGQLGKFQVGTLAEDAHPGQSRKLNGKRADANQDDAEGKLQELGKTVHGDRSGPH